MAHDFIGLKQGNQLDIRALTAQRRKTQTASL
jgi:hypothetical protein